MKKKTFAKGLGIGAAIGTLFGVVAGMLTAPKSGKELRKDLAGYATKMRKDVEVTMGKASKVTKETYAKAVEEVTEAYNKVKDFDKKDLMALKAKLLSEWEDVAKKFKKVSTKKTVKKTASKK